MYLRIIDNTIHYPYTIEELKKDNANISFPTNLSDLLLEEGWQMFKVENVVKPNDYTKNITEGTPTLTNGKYYQNWIQTDATEQEIQQRISDKWDEVREQRNQLLQECDWTQLADIPQNTKDLWTVYRQELRDITSQSNPYYINWPVKP